MVGTGTVKSIISDRGFGFIESTLSASDIFFHMSALDGLAFDEQLVGCRIQLDAERLAVRGWPVVPVDTARSGAAGKLTDERRPRWRCCRGSAFRLYY